MKLSAALTFVCATVFLTQHVESKPFLKNLFGGIFGVARKVVQVDMVKVGQEVIVICK